MHPLTVILLLIIGNELMGVIGMLLAIVLMRGLIYFLGNRAPGTAAALLGLPLFIVSHKGRTVVQAIDTTWVDLREAA